MPAAAFEEAVSLPFLPAMWYTLIEKGCDLMLSHDFPEGVLDIWIDEIVPCLKNAQTGETEETVVFRVESRSYLRNFRKDNGWRISWARLPKDVEVYALATSRDNEIQGLIGIRNDANAKAAYLYWACTAPHNNAHDFGSQKYSGVGGHLFAIAAEKSIQWGYDGLMYGYAANEKLLQHYVETLHAEFIGITHQYHFIIDEVAAKRLLEVYHYEWNKG